VSVEATPQPAASAANQQVMLAVHLQVRPDARESMRQALAELVDAGPAFVAGQDWGGSTAFAFAAAHPDAARGLAVVEAMPSGPWTEANSKRAGTWFAGFHQIPDLPEEMILGRERTYLEWFYRAYSATPGVPDRHAVDEYLRTYARPGAMASAFARYRGVEREIAHNAHHARATGHPRAWCRRRARLRGGRRRQPAPRCAARRVGRDRWMWPLRQRRATR
jgi:pimeloyl-ACP methyl ester carboxylesterase